MHTTLSEDEQTIRDRMDFNILRGQAACLLIGQYAIKFRGRPAIERFKELLERWPFRDLWHKAGEYAAVYTSSYRRRSTIYDDEDLHAAFCEERWKALEDMITEERILEMSEVVDLTMFFEHDTTLDIAMKRLQDYREARDHFVKILQYSHKFSEEEITDIRGQMADLCKALPEIVISGANAEIEEDQ